MQTFSINNLQPTKPDKCPVFHAPHPKLKLETLERVRTRTNADEHLTKISLRSLTIQPNARGNAA